MLNLDEQAFHFSGRVPRVLVAALLNGPYRTDAQTLALTTAATGLTLGSVPATVTLTSLPGFARRCAPRKIGRSGDPHDRRNHRQACSPAAHQCVRGQAGCNAQNLHKRSAFRWIYAIAPKYGAEPARGIEISRGFDVSNLDISSDDEGLRVTLVPVAGLAEAPRDLSLQIRRIYFIAASEAFSRGRILAR